MSEALPQNDRSRSARLIVGGISAAWYIGVLLPIVALVGLSMVTTRGMTVVWTFSLNEYATIFGGARWELVLRTLRLTMLVTLIEFVLAFPFALWLAKSLRNGWPKTVLLVLLVVPFFLSPAARTIVWRAILGREGLANSMLVSAGIVDQPLDWLLFSEFSVVLGLIGPYFPSMVWPLYISLSLIDDELVHASRDLGASEWQTLRHIILPLAVPGIIAGVVFTAIPMLGDNISVTLLGGGNIALVAESITTMVGSLNFSGAAALATVLFLSVGVILLLIWLMLRRLPAFASAFSRLRQ